MGGSDPLPLWENGFNAILAIEEESDFNPCYHQSGDNPDHLDVVFFTDYVKGSVGTFAHLSGCLLDGGFGQLVGQVIDEDSLVVPGASVIAQDSYGNQYSASTDASGYYTRTLVTDLYTVTAYGYLPLTVTDVSILTDTQTIQNFNLPFAPLYLVSGFVSEAGSGQPLTAEITFEGSPVTASTDPSTGYYQAALPQGDYLMHVRAVMHRPGR